MPIVVPAGRDLRLDLFRGLALWLIFLDHIPANIVNWVTIRNYGFSDAAEIFVCISGYTAAFVYGRTMEQRGVVVAGARILKRAWQVYVAHVFIFVIFMAEIAYLTRSIDNPLYNEEMGALDFMKEPGDTLIQALLLKFKPVFMDVLPLYIVLLVAFLVVMTWYFPRYAVYIPKPVQDWMYPIDKTNMDVLRFVHFLALAVLTVRFIPVDWPGLKSPLLRPMILCGQHSLEIFCLG